MKSVESSAMDHSKGIEPPKPKKIIDHLRIHPQMGGGVSVHTHFTSLEHAPKVKNFGMTDGSGFKKHIASITGMPMDEAGEPAGGGDEMPGEE